MKAKEDFSSSLILIALIFLVYVVLLPKSFIGVDGANWQRWASCIFSNELGAAYYNADISYPPIYLYSIKIFSLFFNDIQQLLQHLFLTRIIALLFDFVSALSILYFIRQAKEQPFNILFLLLNIAFIYNSLIWWQTDSIHTAFILLSVFLSLKRKIIWSAVCFMLAVNSKLNAFIYSPVLLFLWLPLLKNNFKILGKAALACLFLLAIIWLPFLLKNNVFHFFESLLQRANYYHYVSMKAYNIWYLFLTENPRNIDDTNLVFNVFSYKNVGLFFYSLPFIAALIPLAAMAWSKWKSNHQWQEEDFIKVFTVLALITLVTFYFPTRMHERYAYAAVVFLFIIGLLSNNYRLYILTSIAYFFNLEKEAQFLLIPNELDNILKPEIFAVLYLIVIVVLYKQLYSKSKILCPST